VLSHTKFHNVLFLQSFASHHIAVTCLQVVACQELREKAKAEGFLHP